jgi:mannosyl-3-phosphoglycerate phosphatase
MPYTEIKAIMEKIKNDTGLKFKGYGDMTSEEVAAETGLDLISAHNAKEREYDETVKLEGTLEDTERFLSAIANVGLHYTHGGRAFNVMGGSDKGRAASILIELFRKKLGEVKTAGIGDSLNDLPMLQTVDIPFLVQKPDGSWEDFDLTGMRKIEGIGPYGWKKAVTELLSA